METLQNGVNRFGLGDLVLSMPNNDFRYLVGTVLKVNPVGSPEHDRETENETDDIHVNFQREDYSLRRIVEIETQFRGLNGKDTPYVELSLDDVIMAPEHLIRLTGVDADVLRSLLLSEESAARFCAQVRTERADG